MDKDIPEIYNSLLDIAWHFGSQGVNGECCGDLSLVEFMALKKTYETKECSIQEIGNALNFTKSGATRIIDRLEKKGYILRKRSLLDGRVCCVTVTAQGTQVMSKIVDQNTSYLGGVLKDFEPHRIVQIKEVLENLLCSVRQHETTLMRIL
ncbi:MarR family transcriptional regulator [Desulfosporosinus sp.]|uniref:MarR family winged helix-turn-helix transcriptional regulator n=1 Tax=Desulfosporosinus sp. TaxID=157907 RepID=UPI0026068B59|nr:MarR family transcriptional regulator [Desulfosporosinus sp.]